MISVFAGLACTGARADSLLTNGNFTETSGIGSYTSPYGQIGYDLNLTDWAVTTGSDGKVGYNFVFTPGSADNLNDKDPGDQGINNVHIAGPQDGFNNGFSATDIPGGGNIVGLDGGETTRDTAITQTVTGLTVGTTYALSFWWADAQSYTKVGATKDSITASFGDLAPQNTGYVTNVSDGFSGWIYQTDYFTADSTTAVISLENYGLPTGVPPFALLADVSLTVPEPASAGLFLAGLAGLVAFARLRRGRATAAACQ
jgi:hypothetical protein